VKISLVDVEIIGLAEMLKMQIKNKKQRQNISQPLAKVGWASEFMNAGQYVFFP